MRGVRAAKELVAGFLRAELPPYLVSVRLDWDLTADELPDPVDYLAREPAGTLDRYPLVAVTGMRAPRYRRLETIGDASLFEVTYALRVFVWVLATGFEETIDRRDDLTQAVVNLLLDAQVFAPDQNARIEETTLAVDYSDVTAGKGDRFLAGAYLAFELRVEETLQRSDRVRGTVSVVAVDGEVFGPEHPALA